MTDPTNVAVMMKTGQEDSFLLGTNAELTAFAHYLLRVLNDPSEFGDLNVDQREVHGIDFREVTGSFTCIWGDAVIDGLWLVDTEHERDALINVILGFWQQSIDWATKPSHGGYRPTIVDEGAGPEEAFLICTLDDLKTFAQTILSAVRCQGQQLDYLGIKSYWLGCPLTQALETDSDITIVDIVVVDSSQDRQELINRMGRKKGHWPIGPVWERTRKRI